MITQQQWDKDRIYISQLRYGITKYNHIYADKIPYLKRSYGPQWKRIPYASTVEEVNDLVG